MGIKRYLAVQDNTITNAYKGDLVTTGVSGNMGASDILEIYTISKQATTSSLEKSRVLIKFPVDEIETDVSGGLIKSYGSQPQYYLRLFNAKHGEPQARNFVLSVYPISRSWTEGEGLDMEDFNDEYASNWISASDGVAWTTPGCDFITSGYTLSQSFDIGNEDLELNITSLVNNWMDGAITNNGVIVMLETSSYENNIQKSYYTKKFFARGTEFFFKRPVIEARFDDHVQDDRGNFYFSSSLATGEQNLNTIYLYNRPRGVLQNIPAIGTGQVYVSVYSGSTTPAGSALTLVADGINVTAGSPTVVTGGWVSTGVYSASFALTAAATPLETIFDVWHNGNLATQYYTGSINMKSYSSYATPEDENYVCNITNLKTVYDSNETANFRVYFRPRNWYPSIYTIASADPVVYPIVSASYSIYRITDNTVVIPHLTSSCTTCMSYDVSGNYFTLDMNLLQPDYSYGVEVSTYDAPTNSWKIQREKFRFRVENRESV